MKDSKTLKTQEEIPIYRDMRKVRAIPEGTYCYYKTVRSESIKRITKIEGKLYVETLERL